jgi:hypothetical protein
VGGYREGLRGGRMRWGCGTVAEVYKDLRSGCLWPVGAVWRDNVRVPRNNEMGNMKRDQLDVWLVHLNDPAYFACGLSQWEAGVCFPVRCHFTCTPRQTSPVLKPLYWNGKRRPRPACPCVGDVNSFIVWQVLRSCSRAKKYPTFG